MKREIEPELYEWFNKKLSSDHEAYKAIAERNPRTLFIRAAIACVGIREEGGDNKGRLVELLQKTLGNAEREPWCMSMVQSCLAYVEKRLGVTSPIAASEHCLTVWNDTPVSQRVQSVPAPGAIIIWRHGSTSSGHTGVTLTDVKSRRFDASEGNTSSGLASNGLIERDGGGAYRTNRSLDGAGSMKVVGFLKPF